MIYIRLQSQQPVCVSADLAQGPIRRTLDYIPGSALRGALAARLREWQPALSHKAFTEYILADGALFQNLLPVAKGRSEARWLPATARSCKLYPGFASGRQQVGQRPQHGVRDVLYDYLKYVLATPKAKATALPKHICNYEGKCDLPLEPFAHFYVGHQKGDYLRTTVSRRQVMQTAIDPHRETASPANLFTVEVLEEGQDFDGYFSLGAGIDEEAFCGSICRTGDTLRVGYGRTRGLGLMTVQACRRTASPRLWPSDLQERLEQFNDKAAEVGCAEQDHTLFSLTLLSDTIVLDPCFRHRAQIDSIALAEEIAPRLGDAKLLLCFAETRIVHGWSTPHGLPLTADRAITAGSTFVFQTGLGIEELASLFANVEGRGMGERTDEGFGRIVICHPFHQEVSMV